MPHESQTSVSKETRASQALKTLAYPFWCVPQDSAGREQELVAKLASKQSEQAELAGRVAECQAKLEAKVQDLRAVADAKQQVGSMAKGLFAVVGSKTSQAQW